MPLSQNKTQQNMIAYLHLYIHEKRRLIFSFILSLIQTLSIIPISLIIQFIFDEVIPNKERAQLLFWLGVFFFLFFINACALLWNRHITLGVIKTTIGNLRSRIMNRLLFFDRTFYTETDLDRTHTNVVQNTERLDCMTSALLTQFIPGILIAFCLFILLLRIDFTLSFIAFLAIPLFYVTNRFLGERVKDNVRRFHETFAQFSKNVTFVLTNHDLIQSAGVEQKEQDNQHASIEALRITSQRMAWFSTAYTVIQSNQLILIGILVLIVGGQRVIDETMTIGALLSFYIALNFFSTHAKMAANVIPTILEGLESLNALAPLFPKTNDASPEMTPFKSFAHSIRFHHVYFSYPQGFSLNDIHLEIPKHSAIGIYGPSGSGKSTLVHLLLGLHKPHKGTIFIDDQNLQEIDLISFRKKIGVLLQDPQILTGTIQSFLTYGLETISEKDMNEACEIVCIQDFINTLENGYQTEIGNRGTKLSGGQRQRLALARTLLRKPELLILDEPDNHLGDELFLQIINNMKKQKLTLIIISHSTRLTEILDAQYFFDKQTLISDHKKSSL